MAIACTYQVTKVLSYSQDGKSTNRQEHIPRIRPSSTAQFPHFLLSHTCKPESPPCFNAHTPVSGNLNLTRLRSWRESPLAPQLFPSTLISRGVQSFEEDPYPTRPPQGQ